MAREMLVEIEKPLETYDRILPYPRPASREDVTYAHAYALGYHNLSTDGPDAIDDQRIWRMGYADGLVDGGHNE